MIRDVLTVHRGDLLIDAAHTMIGAHVSCLVVLEDYHPIGIITERDFLKKLGMSKPHSSSLLVNDLMTKKIFSVDTHLDLFEAQKIMKTHNFRKLVIIEKNELQGIITQTDLCKVLAALKSPCAKPPVVKDVMTKKVLKASEGEKFLKVKKLMASKDIGSVVIVEKGEIRGIFTEFDVGSEFFLNPNRLRNAYMNDLMTQPIVCITPDFDLFQVNKIMIEHNFRRLPVILGDDLVGIITQTDVARALYQFIEKNKDCDLNKQKTDHKPQGYSIKKMKNIILYQHI